VIMIKDISLEALSDIISETKKAIIIFHERPDGDAVGSAFALKLLIEALGGRAYCLSGDEIPERLRFLTDGLQDSALKDSLPDGFDGATVIAVDCGSASQIGKLYEVFPPSISIDHHGTTQRFCDGYTDSSSAATAEIICDIGFDLLKKGRITALPYRFAECVYAAISSDTGCFRFSNATPDTHKRAARLLSLGIDASDINHRLFSSKTRLMMIAEAESVKKLRTFANGKIAVVAFTADEIRELGIKRENFDAFIEVARSLDGAKVAISVRRSDGDTGCRVSMRSSSDVNVSDICAVFGGGGHVRAAGCTIDTEDVDEAVRLIVKETESRLKT